MQIIAPVKQFLVDYKINNPSDTNTYFVRSVIKNSISGEVLATLNLTDNGNQYFSYLWTTPNDASGNGLQISVFTTVYTDSGYTTESTIYGTTLDGYIIRQLAGQYLFGGGYNSGASKEEIKKILAEAINDIKSSQPSINLSEVIEAVGGVEKSIGQKFKEKMAFILRIGEKADRLENIDSSIVSHIKEINEAISKMAAEHSGFRQALKKTLAEFPLMLSDAMRRVVSTYGDKNAKALTEATQQLVRTLATAGESLSKKITEEVEKVLSQPIDIQLQTASIQRKQKQPEEPVQVSRGSRLAKLIKA